MAVEFETRLAVGQTGGGTTAALNMQRSQLFSPEVLQWVKDGRVYNVLSGTLTTPATITPAALIRQQPQLIVRVPAGRVIVPVYAQFLCEATGVASATLETLMSVSDNDPGTSNGTAVVATNVNTRYAALTGFCSAYKDFTNNSGTAPTNVSDVWRSSHAIKYDNAAHGALEQVVYSPFSGRGVPVVVGALASTNTFYVHAAATVSASGFVVLAYAEFSYTEFYGA